MDEESNMQQRIIKRVTDGSGSLIGVLVTASAFIGLHTFTRRRLTEDGLASALLSSAPELQMSHFGRARRFTLCFLALLVHTINALVYVAKIEKDHWCSLMKGTGSGITLIFCIGLLVLLYQSFPITKDVVICGVIFGFLYAVLAATVTLYMDPTWSDTVLGLIHTLITLFMSILRFSCQAGFLKFEKFPLLVAILGSIGSCLPPLIPLPKLSKISAYKVATLIGGVSRLLDVIFIMGLVPRDKVNHLLVSLQEFLI